MNKKIQKAEEEDELLVPSLKQWDNVDRMWNIIPVKVDNSLICYQLYNVSMPRGQIVNKKFLYKNLKAVGVSYKLVTNMENIIEVITNDLVLAAEETQYVKLRFLLPRSACIVTPKLAFLDNGVVREGLQFDITVI